jgi:heterodisulfide reductase subunit A-like polyferredoxin
VVDDFYEATALDQLLAQVAAKKLDSLVLAGDSPYAFRQTRNGERLYAYLAELGIDRNRLEVVNLVNMVARANHGAPRAALQEKARLLTEVALDKVRDARPLAEVEIAPRKAVALVGFEVV